MAQLELSLSDIYKAVCLKCQEKIISLVKDKMTDQAIRQTLEGKPEPEKEE